MSASSGSNQSARQTIIGRMRQGLNRAEDDDAKETVRSRLATPKPTLIPARADLEPEDRIQLFIGNATAVDANVERVERYDDLPGVIASYLRQRNLPMRAVKAKDHRLDSADWSSSLLDVSDGRPSIDDPIGLTTAFAGIAETGTLLLASDADHPTTLAFLPETAIIVLPVDRITRAYEDALHAFRADRSSLPRSMNFVTGPSRSGDIEQTLQLGAHGPKRLLIVLVDEASPEPPINLVSTAGSAP
jgi:L-lactate dehydrogenase complex protein LldG